MRFLLSVLLAVTALSACRLEPPGAMDLYAAHQIYYGPDNVRYSGETLSPDSLALLYTHFDAAIEAGHPKAPVAKAHAQWMSEGLLASEPLWRQIAHDSRLAWSERDVAYGVLALIARNRPRLDQGLRVGERAGSGLRFVDAVGEAAVLRDAAAAGSAQADSVLDARLRVLREQAARGNREADSLLVLLDA